MVVRVDSGEKFYCGKNWAEQPACRTNMGAVKWSIRGALKRVSTT